MITWVVGKGGLLGTAVARRAGRLYEPGPVPWHDPKNALTTLHHQARAFEQAVGTDAWRVVWAAGAATTSTPRAIAMEELQPLEGLLTGLCSALPAPPGAFFLASSAGGVYAGASHPPFSARTTPVPLSAYGDLKLAQEARTVELLGHLTTVTIGRISNVYGPGQNLDKLQGLISRLALAAATRQPINIFVSLDTIRDYIFSEDAADVVLASSQPHPKALPPRIEVLASGRGTTVGQLLRTMNEIAKRNVPVALGSHPSSDAQALDLRLTPTRMPRQLTPLPAGMKAVHEDILERVQMQSLTR